MASQFSRLAPFIREYIYEKKWHSLRDIQEAAIKEIYDGDSHILIASPAATGKTEACFFPVVSLLYEERPPSVGALYISPLKALINDQAQRLLPLAEMAGLPLWRWHGDVSARHKKSLLENPSGILQITPESLEALLMRSHVLVRAMFSRLSFVIIDEVHAFMGSERGSQILCQLARIEEAALCRPRRIGLSATLGDYRQAAGWLALGSSRVICNGGEAPGTAVIRGRKGRRRIRIAVDHFAGEKAEEQLYYESLYMQVRGKKSIIFTNSRIEAEDTIARLRKLSAKFRDTDRFYMHHGSVSAGLRSETEQELRDSSEPVTAAATATLEMGIDIGKLDRVIQIGPPLSVSAFVQRLGRSGRLKQKPEIYFTSCETKPGRDSTPVHPVNSLPFDLVKTIAVIELYLKEKWLEGGDENPLPYSLLVHQCLSILCSMGAHSRKSLERRILCLPAFSRFSENDFNELLDHLITLDLVEKTDDGEIIAGLETGHLASHYSFYSVFADTAEFRVTAAGREIGYVNFMPPVGSSIVLGGRHWRVENVAQREREIAVSPADAGSRLLWRGSAMVLHRKTAAYMRKILAETTDYPYLSQRARTRLTAARKLARQWHVGEEVFIPAEPRAGVMKHGAAAREPRLFVLLPWLGSRSIRTLLLVMQNREHGKTLGIKSLSTENDFSINITSVLPIPRFRSELADILKKYKSLESLYPLIDPARIPRVGKFDPYLPPQALKRQYAQAMLCADINLA
ncbi:MAG: DEAD/DEAH box helicase [Treponema sp.]|nr:DEAD/DEAH box helicase [Treponema sp.]